LKNRDNLRLFVKSLVKSYGEHSFFNGTFILLVLISIISSCKQDKSTTSDPTQALVWEKVDADSIEVWIDSIKMDVLAGDEVIFHPFPLAFGKHEWFIKSYKKGLRAISDKQLLTVDDGPLESLPDEAILLRYGWSMQSSLLAGAVVNELTKTQGWNKATVPSTVLTTLVRNGKYPNPYISQNNLKIPDANDSFNIENDLLKYSHIPGKNPFSAPYWFVTNFDIPKAKKGKTIWLNINEINYAAKILLNGKIVADTATVKGMERRFKFEISDDVSWNKPNQLAILIYPPYHVGKPAPPPTKAFMHPGRNMGEDPEIAKDYTKWDVLGWDWQPGVRDRDMGITEDVYVSFTGSLDLMDPYVTAYLPLPDTSYADMQLTVSVNNLQDAHIKAFLMGKVKSKTSDFSFSFDRMVKLSPGMTTVTFDKKEISDFHINNPALWWPINYGAPNLYELELQISYEGEVSDRETVTFGIRDVETYIGNHEREYKINGQRIYPRGGNWVMDLLLTWNKTRYEQEIDYSVQTNLNLQRVWGLTGVPPHAFFDAADENGIMIWQDFLHDHWGTKKNNPEYMPELDLYKKATTDIIKKLRNHPSLVIWCGGNEGVNPREDIIMNELLPAFDPDGGRHYLKNSLGDGLHGSGPYHTIRPKAYFEESKVSGFSSELGPSGFPTLESLHRFLPDLGESWEEGYFPIQDDWAYHDANERQAPDQRRFIYYDSLVRYDYGFSGKTDSSGIAEYAWKAQLVNYDTYRSVVEAINHQLWESASGYAIWKYNSSWPSLVWQLYDWYLTPNAGFYAMRNANKPVHIQLNRQDFTVALVNTTFKDKTGTLEVSLMDTNLNQLWKKTDTINVDANSVFRSAWNVPIEDSLALYFVDLKFKNSEEKLSSSNFYWINTNDDYSALDELPESNINISDLQFASSGSLSFAIENSSPLMAFFNHFQIIDSYTNEEVLPCYWDDNYITLLPSERRLMSVKFDPDQLRGELVIKYKGQNVSPEAVLYK